MKKEIKKICIECGKEFIRKRNNQKLCSDKCRRKRSVKKEAEYRENRKRLGKVRESVVPSGSLRDMVREVMSARDKYGRPMSYGKYVASLNNE